jgi:hypothetical protein
MTRLQFRSTIFELQSFSSSGTWALTMKTERWFLQGEMTWSQVLGLFGGHYLEIYVLKLDIRFTRDLFLNVTNVHIYLVVYGNLLFKLFWRQNGHPRKASHLRHYFGFWGPTVTAHSTTPWFCRMAQRPSDHSETHLKKKFGCSS